METTKTMRDSWNADLYDGKHSFVSKYGDDLIELLVPEEGEKILDLGCGTGDLAKRLYDLGVAVIGVDKSENMVAQAMGKYSAIPFQVRDATDLGYHDEFDAVFSNATLHWIKSPENALHCIYDSLKKGGRFIAELGGKGNVQLLTDEIVRQLKESGDNYKPEQFPWYFPSIGEYSSLMEKVGFRVTYAQHFDRPTLLDGEDGVKNWIEMFCGGMFEGIDKDRKEYILAESEKNLKSILYHDGNWIADYKRIRIIGVKE